MSDMMVFVSPYIITRHTMGTLTNKPKH